MKEIKAAVWWIVDDGYGPKYFPTLSFSEDAIDYIYKDEDEVTLERKMLFGVRKGRPGIRSWEGWELYDTEEAAYKAAGIPLPKGGSKHRGQVGQ